MHRTQQAVTHPTDDKLYVLTIGAYYMGYILHFLGAIGIRSEMSRHKTIAVVLFQDPKPPNQPRHISYKRTSPPRKGPTASSLNRLLIFLKSLLGNRRQRGFNMNDAALDIILQNIQATALFTATVFTARPPRGVPRVENVVHLLKRNALSLVRAQQHMNTSGRIERREQHVRLPVDTPQERGPAEGHRHVPQPVGRGADADAGGADARGEDLGGVRPGGGAPGRCERRDE